MRSFLVAAALITSAGCSAGDPRNAPVSPTVPVTPTSAIATTIELSQSTLSFTALGDSSRLTATVRDQRGGLMAGQTITWTAVPDGVVAIGINGDVRALSPGNATITATVSTVSARATVSVAQTPTTLVLDRESLAFGRIGATDSATASVRDARGNAIRSPSIVWTSANPAVAQVTSTGVVRAEGSGFTTVSASVGTLTARVRITVNAWGTMSPQIVSAVDGAILNAPDGWIRQHAITDFDRDGNEDVVFNTWAACAMAGCGVEPKRNPRGTLLLLQRTATGGLSDVTVTKFGTRPQVWVNSAVTGDFNADGIPDFVLPGFTDVPPVDAPSEAYMSRGAGYEKQSDATEIWAHGAYALDADRDGCLDVLVGHNRQPFWKGNCAGAFTKMQFADPQIVPIDNTSRDLHLSGSGMGICSGDFNKDGSTDLVYTDAIVAVRSQTWTTHPADNVVVEVNWKLPRPQFVRVHTLPVPVLDRQSAPGTQRSHDMRCEVRDLDRDGDDDLFISSTPWAADGNWGGSAWQVYLNDGNFVFRDISDRAFPGRTAQMAFGFNPMLRDLNGDGIIDLLFTGAASDATKSFNPAWLGNGDGTFRPSTAANFEALREEAMTLLMTHLDAPAWARGHGDWGEVIPLRRATGEYDFLLAGQTLNFRPEPGSRFGRPTAYLIFMPVGVRF